MKKGMCPTWTHPFSALAFFAGLWYPLFMQEGRGQLREEGRP